MSALPLRVPAGATANRPTWDELPPDLRAVLEAAAGSPVRQAVSQGGGFTSGFASRLLLDDGRRLFVKAASRVLSPVAHPSYLTEASVVAVLPAAVPAPRLLQTLEHGDWVVLVFEDVDAHAPARPWVPQELDAVLSALTGIAEALTPAPVGVPVSDLAGFDGEMSFWRKRSAGDADALAVALEPELEERVDELAAREAGWVEACDGDTATHFDLRDDNVLLAHDGRVLVCDWNWLTRGAAWLDLAALLVSVHGDGLDADAIWASHPLARDVPDESLLAFLAAIAGLFVESAARPRDERSPWLREHQAWWRDASLSWLGARLDP